MSTSRDVLSLSIIVTNATSISVMVGLFRERRRLAGRAAGDQAAAKLRGIAIGWDQARHFFGGEPDPDPPGTWAESSADHAAPGAGPPWGSARVGPFVVEARPCEGGESAEIRATVGCIACRACNALCPEHRPGTAGGAKWR